MKVQGYYASIVRGVSQQNPQNRLPGQHAEQVNLLPEPVQGLARRHGSEFIAEQPLTGVWADIQADSNSWRRFVYTDGANQYAVVYRSAAGVSGVPALVYSLITKQWLNVLTHNTDLAATTALASGITAITSAGKYVIMAANSLTPAATTTAAWGALSNQANGIVWVRGGAYSRKFTVRATVSGGSPIEFSYTTPASSYQGTLDTSQVPLFMNDPAGGTIVDTEPLWVQNGVAKLTYAGFSPSSLTVKKDGVAMLVGPPDATHYSTFGWDILFDPMYNGATNLSATYTHNKVVANPFYTNQIAQLQAQYQAAVTAWVGSAAAAIQPEAIAEQLRVAGQAAGWPGPAIVRVGSALVLPLGVEVTVSDGGDNSLIRGTGATVSTIDDLAAYALDGKIVKVQARSVDDPVYYKAVKKDTTATGLTKVRWEECAGAVHTITAAFLLGRAEGNNFYIASSAAHMNALTGLTDAPDYSPSVTGDQISSPLPAFIGNRITALTVFQDRLGVGSRGVMTFSRTGDYLNFFKSTLLTVPASDPVDLKNQGLEADELRYPVLYDKDLVIFARDRQYLVSGRMPLTPTSANMQMLSSHASAAVVPPVVAGQLVFYARQLENSVSIFQMQPSLNIETPESFLVSPQLSTYIPASVIELEKVDKPSCLVVRSTAARNSLYLFTYMDLPNGRQQDAWHRWEYSVDAGVIVGTVTRPEGVVILSVRQAHGQVWAVADLQPLVPTLSARPYLDSNRAWATVAANTGSMRPNTPLDISAAFDATTTRRFIGCPLVEVPALQAKYPAVTELYAGFNTSAYVTLTNPYVKEQRTNDPVIQGTLTITSFKVSFRDTSGHTVTLDEFGDVTTETFNGRVVGSSTVGVEPVPLYHVHDIPVLRGNLDFSLTLGSRQWFPFTIDSIAWVGQYFNRTQRI